MQRLKIAILAFGSFSDSAGMAVHCQFSPQESLTGFQKLFLNRVPVSSYQCQKAKLEQTHFFKVQSWKITVCIVHYQVGEEIECTTFQIKYKLSSFEKFASLISHFFCQKGGTQHDGVRTTMKKGTPKILSKSISKMPMSSLVGHQSLICHKIFLPYKITQIFGENH